MIRRVMTWTIRMNGVAEGRGRPADGQAAGNPVSFPWTVDPGSVTLPDMTAGTSEGQATAPAEPAGGLTEAIDHDLPCGGCGYNLRAARRDGACPECGVPVARSIGRDNVLWEARPAWLRSLSLGVWLMIAAQVLYGAGMLIASQSGPAANHSQVILTTALALSLMYAAGVWLLTRRERLFVRSPRRDVVVRWVARIATLGIPAAVAIIFWFVVYRPGLPGRAMRFVVFGLISLVAPSVLTTFLHLRGLAKRVLSRRMAEYAGIVAVGGTVTAGVITTIMWLEVFGISVSLARDMGLILPATLLVSVLLFYLWALLVLVLFAIAFARASRTARLLWGQHAAPA
jgi:hypothetical protein